MLAPSAALSTGRTSGHRRALTLLVKIFICACGLEFHPSCSGGEKKPKTLHGDTADDLTAPGILRIRPDLTVVPSIARDCCP